MKNTKEISEGAMKAFRDLFSSLYPDEDHISIEEAKRAEYSAYRNSVFFLQVVLPSLGTICGLIAIHISISRFSPNPWPMHVQPGWIVLSMAVFGACVLGFVHIARQKEKLWRSVAWKKLKKFDAAWVNLEVAYFGREEVIEDIKTADQLRKLIELETRQAAAQIYSGPVNRIPSLGTDPLAQERNKLRGLESIAASLKLFGLATEVQVMSDEKDPDCHDDFVKMIDLRLCQEVGALASAP